MTSLRKLADEVREVWSPPAGRPWSQGIVRIVRLLNAVAAHDCAASDVNADVLTAAVERLMAERDQARAELAAIREPAMPKRTGAFERAEEAYRKASKELADEIDAFSTSNHPTAERIGQLRAVRDAKALEYREAIEERR
jgi:hypothetical protein